MSGLLDRVALVTGASGFIGEHLCRRLLAEGASVHALQRHRSPHLPAEIRQWSADAADLEQVRSIWAETEPDLVFHLASLVTGSRCPSVVLPSLRANLVSSVNVCLLASQLGCGRVVTAGSMEEPIGRNDEIPGSPYAAAKGAATGYGRMFHALYGTPVVTLRVFMVYGPGQRDESKLIPYVVRSLLAATPPELSSGERLVDWIYVDDVVDAFVAGASAPEASGGVVDVGSGTELSIRAIVERIADLMAAPVRPLFGARSDRPLERRRRADVEHARSSIGWKPAVDLDEGLRRTIDWYRNNPSGPAP